MGWWVSKQEFSAALSQNFLINELLEHNRFKEDANPAEQLLFYGKNDLVEQYLSPKDLTAIIQYDQLDLLVAIEESGASFTNETVLTAARYGSLAILDYLITKGCEYKGALIQAVDHLQEETVRYLLSHNISQKEIEQAKLLAYQKGAFSILALFTL